jgi:septum formation protein
MKKLCTLKNKKYILASQSPRRKDLMKLLNIEFTIIASDIVEELREDLTHIENVENLAFQKALSISKDHQNSYVLGFDTLVILNDEALGKPIDRDDAFKMLRRLSGNYHTVITGCAIINGSYKDVFSSSARVRFNEMSDEEINEYLDTEEPYDKAGSYGIQGFGARYISCIDGDFYTIMGVPLQKLYNKLRDLK